MTHWSEDLPTHVWVGFRTYSIKAAPASHLGPRFGTHLPPTAEIILSLDQSSPEAAATLLHELLHAVLSVFGEPEWKEEPIVTLLAAGLATIMQANPDVFAWIARNLAVTA